MSNFEYVRENGKVYLTIGKNRIKILWKERWVPAGETIKVYPTKIELSIEGSVATSISLDTNTTTETLEATFTPAGTTDKSINWSSSDTTIATVDKDGIVTAAEPHKAGDFVITATSVMKPSIKATIEGSASWE